MSTAQSIRYDASMDAYHAKKNYEAAAEAYETALHHIERLKTLATDALVDDEIAQINDWLDDVKITFGKAVDNAWEEAR